VALNDIAADIADREWMPLVKEFFPVISQTSRSVRPPSLAKDPLR
jgi:hypothetical protein